MNYRDYKLFSPGEVYHVFNRGVAKQDIFLDDKDYTLFLLRLKEQLLSRPLPVARRTDYHRKILSPGLFQMYAYCLMPNHFHWVMRQVGEVPISELVKRVMTGYGKVFNIKYQRVGGVFQDQFKCVRVETTEQLLWLSAYVHQNPKVGGLVESLAEWPWSSYQEYIGVRAGELVDTSFILKQSPFLNRSNAYEKFVNSSYEIIKARKDIQQLALD